MRDGEGSGGLNEGTGRGEIGDEDDHCGDEKDE